MQIKLITFFSSMFFLLLITGCARNSLKDKLEGFWTVDITGVIIEKNGWDNLRANGIYLRPDFSCDVLHFSSPDPEKITLNTKGIWQIHSEGDENFIIFHVEDNPMSGKYKIEFYRDYEKKLLKMKLSNATTEFTCAKFLQNFDKVKDW